MATATAAPAKVVKRGTVSPSLVSTYGEIFRPKDGFLAQYNIERTEEIKLLGVSTISGIDPLFLGDPGVGKTWMIELLLMVLHGANPEDFFNTMIFKETSADDVLGMRSLPAMKQGKIERMMDGYLPKSVIAYLDEIFKASPSFINSLLDIMANRKLKVGATIHDVAQLLCVFASSNELPDREDLQPFRDRFGLTKFVEPVRTPEGRKTVLDIQDQFQADARRIDLTDAPRLTLDDVHKMRAEVRSIIVPDPVKETLVQVQGQCESAGHPPSQRRMGQVLLAIKGSAWARGEGEASSNDLAIAQHMLWNRPDDAESAHKLVMAVASAFTRKAARAKESLEPILAELAKIKAEIDNADPGERNNVIDKNTTPAFEQMKALKGLRREVREQIDDGQAQGQDTTDLDGVLGEIARSDEWIKKTMIGDEDED